jgi:hypothetical protein
MPASIDILFNRYIDLSEYCPVWSNCYVALYAVVLFCLIVPKHHAFLSKNCCYPVWNTSLDLPTNFVCLEKRYFIMLNSIVDLSKDGVYMPKHRLIMSNNGGIFTNYGKKLLKRYFSLSNCHDIISKCRFNLSRFVLLCQIVISSCRNVVMTCLQLLSVCQFYFVKVLY